MAPGWSNAATASRVEVPSAVSQAPEPASDTVNAPELEATKPAETLKVGRGKKK